MHGVNAIANYTSSSYKNITALSFWPCHKVICRTGIVARRWLAVLLKQRARERACDATSILGRLPACEAAYVPAWFTLTNPLRVWDTILYLRKSAQRWHLLRNILFIYRCIVVAYRICAIVPCQPPWRDKTKPQTKKERGRLAVNHHFCYKSRVVGSATPTASCSYHR
jgi:hypothetical protein